MEKKPRVLLVDDEPDFLEPVTSWLESKGYTVMTALSGKEAIDLVKQQHVDIVFLDIRMPEMDGAETLRRIRTFNTDIPVVIVTAVYQEEERLLQDKTLGVSGFFLKQNSLEGLVWTLEATLRLRRGSKPTED